MQDASNGLLAQGPLRAGNTGERVLALRSLVGRIAPEPLTPTDPGYSQPPRGPQADSGDLRRDV